MDGVVVVSIGFKYHFKCATFAFVALAGTLLLLSTKVIQYGVVDRQPVVATG